MQQSSLMNETHNNNGRNRKEKKSFTFNLPQLLQSAIIRLKKLFSPSSSSPAHQKRGSSFSRELMAENIRGFLCTPIFG
jgi:hypothetical protein